MSDKKALAIRVVGDPATEEELERVREAVEETLGTDYTVLIHTPPVELMDTEGFIEEMERLVEQLKKDVESDEA